MMLLKWSDAVAKYQLADANRVNFINYPVTWSLFCKLSNHPSAYRATAS